MIWGNIYHDMGKFNQASSYYQQSLDTLQAHGARIQGLVEVQVYKQNYKKKIDGKIAKNLNNLGINYTKLKQWKQAKNFLFDALQLKKNLGNKKSIASSYNNIGEFYSDKNQLDSALIYYQNAINLVTDRIISNDYIIDKDNLPTTESLNNSIDQPQLMIYLSDQARCLEQYANVHQEKKQLEYLEKAYLTYQKINELCHIILDDLTEESQFIWIEQVRNIYEKAIAVALRLHDLNNENTTYLEGAFTFAESNKAVILYRTLQRYYAQQNQRPTNILPKIQQELTENDLLLEFFVGKDSAIYVFQITQKTIELSKVLHSNTLKKQINDFNFFVKDGKNTGVRAKLNSYQNDAYGIYQALVQPFIKDNKRLIIVPDENLNYVTFSALLTNEPQEYAEFDYSALPYLINKCSITYGYSTAMLLPNPDQKKMSQAVEKAIVYAPTFTEESRGAPLPNTLNQVRGIGEKYEAYIDTGNVTVQDFLHTHIHYQIIYFATHAIADTTDNDSSYILFSDADLYTPDIYQLEMNEKLVIIGACESGNGKTQTGEGIMNLTRAFLSRGSAHVISSLWAVRERETSQILSNFFQFLDEGNDKYNALHLAQKDYIKNSITAHPFYWAAFTHNGHWQKTQKRNYLSLQNLIISFIIIGFGLFFFGKKR